MGQITAVGYIPKTENQYFEEETKLYLDIDPNWNLDPSTPDGLKIASDSEIFANLDESIQVAYDSKDPNKATGIDLNSIIYFAALTRKAGTYSVVAVSLGGVTGTVISAGKTIKSSSTGSIWALDETVVIGVSGSVQTTATCAGIGQTEANINTITSIIDSVGGWQTVTNTAVPTLGTPEETDSQARLRYFSAVASPGNNQVDSMQGALLNVDDVRRVRVYENFTSSVDANGLPAHSLSVLVDGGTDADIALQMYLKKNPGVALNAANAPVNVVVISPTYPSNSMNITFSRPAYVDIVIVLTIQNDGTLPTDADEQIKDAIIEYSEGNLLTNTTGFNKNGFDIGVDVAYSRIITPVNSIIGQYGTSYVTVFTINGNPSNQVILFNELSRFAKSNITVTINA